MLYWQVQAELPDSGRRVLFGVEAEDRESATATALQVIKDALVPVDLQITQIPAPPERQQP